jgi:large subunit ribosomal protein L17
MKHRVGFNRLGRKSSHRKALHRNMVTSLFKHERIRTTKAKAREIRRTAEKMITRAKIDSVHNRRMIARDLKDKAILAKLFLDIGPRFKTRPGGYTRMLKIGYRAGDASEMVLLELVSEEAEEAPKSRKSAKGRKPAEPAATEASEKPKKKSSATASAGGESPAAEEAAKHDASDAKTATPDPAEDEEKGEPADADDK